MSASYLAPIHDCKLNSLLHSAATFHGFAKLTVELCERKFTFWFQRYIHWPDQTQDTRPDTRPWDYTLQTFQTLLSVKPDGTKCGPDENIGRWKRNYARKNIGWCRHPLKFPDISSPDLRLTLSKCCNPGICPGYGSGKFPRVT